MHTRTSSVFIGDGLKHIITMQVTVAAAGTSSRIYGMDEQLIIVFVGTLEALVIIASHVIDRVQHTVPASSLVASPSSPRLAWGCSGYSGHGRRFYAASPHATTSHPLPALPPLRLALFERGVAFTVQRIIRFDSTYYALR